jgi:hypothetical protein
MSTRTESLFFLKKEKKNKCMAWGELENQGQSSATDLNGVILAQCLLHRSHF